MYILKIKSSQFWDAEYKWVNNDLKNLLPKELIVER